MEECIKHFSHEHQLSLFQVDADEEPKPHRCSICGLPILSSPSYTCSLDANCNFFLHAPCTQLPEIFFHHRHDENLYLRKPMLPPGESFPNFTYEFGGDFRDLLNLHPLVAKPVKIKSLHRSHLAHPLVVFCREIACRCDVCGKKENGFFFYCKECGFSVHQDCTILPSVVKLPSHPHPFILAYYLPYVTSKYLRTWQNNSCSICGGEWRLPDGGMYFCGECYSLAHVACAKPSMEIVIADKEFLHLPDEDNTFPRLAIRAFVEKNSSSQHLIKTENKKLLTEYHKHPLILEDACCSSSKAESHDNVVCDACIQPINVSSPYYRCHDCRFVAHRVCAEHIPARIDSFFGPVHIEELLCGHDQVAESFFNSVFRCLVCRRPCNGFSYQMIQGEQFVLFRSDIECAVAPKTVKHTSHKQHILFKTGGNLFISERNCKLYCCSGDQNFNGIYRCVICDYSIHVRCALLPRTIPHKFDDHPLELIMTREDDKGQFCEFCEKQIELEWWYYGCRKCEQYFHINCIPSVGKMSKVKFGKTHTEYQLHQHPLTITRMLTYERNERCGICHKIIQGFSDDQMAFHCSLCHFWLHFSCAAATTNLRDYTKYSFVIEQ